MKVKELIEKLQEISPDANVYYVYDSSLIPLEDDDITLDQDGDVLLHE